MAEPPATSSNLPQAPEPAPPRCANCGTELRGPYCHQCGQPTRHVLRHLPGLVHDGLDLLLDIDGRIMRTLPALYFRPGFLAREYFAGRRMRYIPPFRLMFFLSLLAFLVLQFNLSLAPPILNVNVGPQAIKGNTPAEVRANWRKAEQGIREARANPEFNAIGGAPALDATERALRDSANARLRELGAPPLAVATPGGAASSATAATPATRVAPAGGPASADSIMTAPVPHVAWLPGFLDQRIQEGVAHARSNLRTIMSGSKRASSDTRRRMVNQALSVLPQAMFVMLPLFALLLKLLYLFRRRLYIEHLMVAMYSHAFIYMSLLLWGLVRLLHKVTPAWTGSLLMWVGLAIWLWVPVYLLLMQKRVYAQGWGMTLLKYAVIGTCYSILVSMAVVGAGLVGLAS